MPTHHLTQKVWNFATVLRDDGVSYGDYLEQITFLLFLKMADELERPPHNRRLPLPALKDEDGREIYQAERCDWPTLSSKRGAALESFYLQVLRSLSTEPGLLGQIFVKSQNQIQDPAKLARLIALIDEQQWTMLGTDVKGDIYEGLLSKNAEDVKSGAGQYFTPRALIQAMVDCVRPEPGRTIHDPSCGTGGFFLAAYDFLVREHTLSREQKRSLKEGTFSGNEIVPATRRMCLMNMYLHGIGEIDGESPVSGSDALIAEPATRVDYVLANPPFGKKSSMTFTNEAGEAIRDDLSYERQDFWTSTSNKQLNFLQHIRSCLKVTGRAAVVLPDNVLFEGGAGETVRRQLMQTTRLHTILRLPTGIFYANGVKANVLFFDNRPGRTEPWTDEVYFYDYRTNVHHTQKRSPVTRGDLDEFVACYALRQNAPALYDEQTNPEGRWRAYSYDELLARDKVNLDLFWLRDQSLTDLDNLPPPEVIAAEIIEELEAALEAFKGVEERLRG